MSTEKRFNLLSPLLSQIEGAQLQTQAAIDSAKNISNIKLAYKAWICATADILFNFGKNSDSVSCRLSKMAHLLVESDSSELLLCCKDAYDTLIDLISLKCMRSYDEFKAHLKTERKIDIDAFVAPVNFLLTRVCKCICTYTGGIWRASDKREVCALAQYFGFLMKLPLDNTDVEEKSLEDYLALENDYPDQLADAGIISELQSILERNWSDFEYDGSLCRHGNGSVANKGCKSLYAKYHNFDYDMQLDVPYAQHGKSVLEYLPLPPHNWVIERCSKLQFVPKNVAKLRTISMEPVSLQFVQQGVMRAMYQYFKRSKYYRYNIKLEDQSQNQQLAYDGSIDNYYSTIDLSSASDLIGYRLVEKLFENIPQVYDWIMNCRSTHTLLPNGEKIELNKFAPMGSAVSFPLETSIFAACAELAISHCMGAGLVVPRNRRFFSVYGDDIIVPHYAFKECVDILTRLGFKINQDKSYHDSPFKESCGVNYWAGVDITPLKWKVSNANLSGIDADSYMALCSIANNAYKRHMSILRCFVIKTLLANDIRPIFGESLDKSPTIYSPCPTNFHLLDTKSSKRKSGRYQTTYKTYTGVKASVAADKSFKEEVLKTDFKGQNQQIRQCISRDAEEISYFLWQKEAEHRIEVNSANQCYDPQTGVLYLDVLTHRSSRTLFKSSSILCQADVELGSAF